MDRKYVSRATEPRPPLRRRIHLLMAFLLVTLSLLFLSLRIRAASSTSSIPSNSTSWHRYVRAPSSHVVAPVTVLEEHSTGRVLNHQGLIAGGEPTVLERAGRLDEVPSVVVDFGMNTVGVLSIGFAGAEGAEGSLPGVRLAFSETLEHLSNSSDFTRSYNVGRLPPHGRYRPRDVKIHLTDFSPQAQRGSPQQLTGGTDQVPLSPFRLPPSPGGASSHLYTPC